ncbi:MAG: hypothetical protein AAFQ89_01550 [Cyanobacteria bacterium J06626_18]
MTPYLCVALVDTWLPLLCPVMIWAVLLAFFLALLMAVKDGIKRLQQLHQIPCDRCRYYTGSQYLRCPVHPLAAFSEAAAHCRDCEPIEHRSGQRRLSQTTKR